MNRRRGDAPASRYRKLLGGVALAFLAFFLAMPVAHAAEVMRVTFVRHAQSEGNASGLIDTKTPGPVLTPLGQQQAQAVADKLGDNNYDAIYASTMVRTQLTAAPMSQRLGLPIQVLPGLQEIEAGVFEGTPEANAAGGYGLYPIAWALPGVIPQIPFDKSTYMPGTNLNGYVFDERVRGALQTMYDNGDRNAVVFSHGGTIMFWTLMNVNNLTMMEKLQLLQTAQLNNTDYVVIEGNNEDGWTLVNWNGKQFSPEPTFEHEVKLQFRTLSRQLSAAADQVKEAFKTGDFVTIATAINRSMADASFSVTKFSRAINAEIIKRTTKAIPTNTQDLQDKVSTGVENLKTSLNATTDSIEQKVQSAPETVSDSTKPADSSPISRAKSKLKTAVDEVVKPRATDLSDGNKALPGVTKPVSRTGEQVQTAVKDAQDRVSSSIKKFGDAVKKATGQTGKTAGANAGADNDTAGNKDAA
ncbi:histidine phosphatase family protein [Mycolicibacterium peregrinum]|uniref:histidine phosphatase family protein n=1 Tax=Mycolicibacterium peregrinum TaxID=43304 RepID=UPI0006D7A1E9|nr:histidine phosphatase family protein [Mycolicibacterium peregrinum]MCV7201190.1 histidine phosphatase family protein [Mycolicibacterium peregrinum]ORW52321.1 phosphoglycerate mutase [Mycolicibacterium peregrinum]OWM05048.1 histidine phosphatase family protein [Mycolicibacterium peregrinum]